MSRRAVRALPGGGTTGVDRGLAEVVALPASAASSGSRRAADQRTPAPAAVMISSPSVPDMTSGSLAG